MRNKRMRKLVAISLTAVLFITALLLYFGGGKPVITAIFRDGAYGTRIEMDTSFGYSIRKYDGGVAVLGKEGLSTITNSGRDAYKIEFPVTKPILSANGSFILAADHGGTTVLLTHRGKERHRMETEQKILTASVNPRGAFAVVTEERGYKGCVRVYNASGKELFSWHSASQNILSAVVSEDSKKLAVALVNTEDLSKLCTVFLFDLDDVTPKVCDVGDENLVVGMAFCGSELLVFGDEVLYGFRKDGAPKFTVDYEGRELSGYSYYSGGIVALGLSGGNEAGKNAVETYDTNGRKKGSFHVESSIQWVDTYGKYVAVNTTDGLFVTDGAGRIKTQNKLDIAPQAVFLCGSRNRVFITSGVRAGMYIL